MHHLSIFGATGDDDYTVDLRSELKFEDLFAVTFSWTREQNEFLDEKSRYLTFTRSHHYDNPNEGFFDAFEVRHDTSLGWYVRDFSDLLSEDCPKKFLSAYFTFNEKL